MGLKHCLMLKEEHSLWCMRTGCLGRYLSLRGRK